MAETKKNNKPALVVLAAGMGSRYGGLKQIDPVGPSGETVLDYSVYDAVRAGFGKVVFVIRKDFAGLFKEQVGRRLDPHIDVAYAYQELDDLPGGKRPPEGRTKPWGTGHAIWSARNTVTVPFGVINADDFYGAGAFRALVEFFGGVTQDSRPLPCVLIAYRLDRTLSTHGAVSRGVIEVTEDGFLARVKEVETIENLDGHPVATEGNRKVPLAGDTLVSMNCWGFDPGIFSLFEDRFETFLGKRGGETGSEFYVADPVEDAIRKGKATFRVMPDRGNWFGVTYPEDKQRVVRSIAERVRAGEYPASLWE